MQAVNPNNDELTVYSLQLEIISGTGLPSKDLSGKSDPFVKVKVGDKEVRTKTIKKNLNPVWNADFRFKFFENPKNVLFTVMDQDMTSNEFIGNATLDLNQQFASKTSAKPVTCDLKLKKKNGKKNAGGSIKVKFTAQKLQPLTLKKVFDQQKETIFKQNQRIDALNAENNDVKKQNVALQKVQEKLALAKDKVDDAVSSSGLKGLIPSKRTLKYERAKIFGFIGGIIAKLYSFYVRIVSMIYAIPLLGYYIDLLVLFFGSLLRLEVGYTVFKGATSSKRPSKKLKLYEMEGNVECKMVRETLCALDLDCMIYPCPGPHDYMSRYRNEAEKLCGMNDLVLPLFVDENVDNNGTPLMLFGSTQIMRHLYEEYGNNVSQSLFEKLRYYVANSRVFTYFYQYVYLTLIRCLPEHGSSRFVMTVKPRQPLQLWSYEASPFCIKVRELLSSLELPYTLNNVAVGSMKKRQEFQIKFGKKYPKWRQKLHLIQVPLLVDPNTDKEIFESEDIKTYLMNTYVTSKNQKYVD